MVGSKIFLRIRREVGVTSNNSSVSINSKACSRLSTFLGVRRRASSAEEERVLVSCFFLHTLPFTSIYKPVLDDYAVEKYGSGYTWREAMAGYTNDLAAHVYSKGFKPRIFNDGVYFNEGSSNQQKFAMHDYIGIDYWSRTSWIGGSPSLETFINRVQTGEYLFAPWMKYSTEFRVGTITAVKATE